MSRIRLAWVLVVLGTWTVRAGAADADLAPDEKLLRQNKVATDGPALLRFLRQHLPTEESSGASDAARSPTSRGWKSSLTS